MNSFKVLKKSQHAHRGSLVEINQEHREAIESGFKNETQRYPVQNLELIEEEFCAQECRIMEFLSNEGVEFKTPWDKIFEYYEKERRKLSEESSKGSSTSISENNGKGKLSLASKLYNQRISKIHEKSHSQSPRPSHLRANDL